MKEALIIFVRNPELGKVKTRLAADVGHNEALVIYKELLQHTSNVAGEVDAGKFVFYHERIEENDIWNTAGFTKKLQSGDILGDKMKQAFEELFLLGYKKIIIIGSDCLELSASLIEEAFILLKESDVVIGPAKDGGYYLLGMRAMHGFIFENKSWSTSSVFNQTMNELQQHQLTVSLLPQLNDIDTAADWQQSKSSSNDL